MGLKNHLKSTVRLKSLIISLYSGVHKLTQLVSTISTFRFNDFFGVIKLLIMVSIYTTFNHAKKLYDIVLKSGHKGGKKPFLREDSECK